MEKTYNPFKMWGSWVGFGVGVLVIFWASMHIYGDPSILIGAYVNTNPITWITAGILLPLFPSGAVLYILIIFITTPVSSFMYGWGIHSLFRKFGSK